MGHLTEELRRPDVAVGPTLPGAPGAEGNRRAQLAPLSRKHTRFSLQRTGLVTLLLSHTLAYTFDSCPQRSEKVLSRGFSGTGGKPIGMVPTHLCGRAGPMCHKDILRRQPSWASLPHGREGTADVGPGRKQCMRNLRTFLLGPPDSFWVSY